LWQFWHERAESAGPGLTNPASIVGIPTLNRHPIAAERKPFGWVIQREKRFYCSGILQKIVTARGGVSAPWPFCHGDRPISAEPWQNRGGDALMSS
jgi:hypothetical protein